MEARLTSLDPSAVRSKANTGQCLTCREFAVASGLPHHTARKLFQTPGFPVFLRRVTWADWILWLRQQNGIDQLPHKEGDPQIPPADTPDERVEVRNELELVGEGGRETGRQEVRGPGRTVGTLTLKREPRTGLSGIKTATYGAYDAADQVSRIGRVNSAPTISSSEESSANPGRRSNAGHCLILLAFTGQDAPVAGGPHGANREGAVAGAALKVHPVPGWGYMRQPATFQQGNRTPQGRHTKQVALLGTECAEGPGSRHGTPWSPHHTRQTEGAPGFLPKRQDGAPGIFSEQAAGRGGAEVIFFPGLDDVHHARHFERVFISISRLIDRVGDFPAPDWILDPESFSTLKIRGCHRLSVPDLADRINRWDPISLAANPIQHNTAKLALEHFNDHIALRAQQGGTRGSYCARSRLRFACGRGAQ